MADKTKEEIIDAGTAETEQDQVAEEVQQEFADVQRVALATGRPLQDISRLAATEAERYSEP